MSVKPFHCTAEPGKTNGRPVSRQMVAYVANVTPMFIALPIALPMSRISLSTERPEAELDRFGFGDLYVQPLGLGWRIKHFDILAGYALYMLMRHLLIRRPSTLAAGAASAPALSIVGFAAGALGSLTAMPGALMVVWCELRGLCKESPRALGQPFLIAVQIFRSAGTFPSAFPLFVSG